MTSPNPTELPEHVRSLVPFGEYQWPRSEAKQTIGHLFEKFKTSFGITKNNIGINTDELKRQSNEALETALHDALESVLLNALDTTYLKWAVSGGRGPDRRLFIHPPMRNDILSKWAKQHNLPIVSDVKHLQKTPNAACVVVPSIEVFFGRHIDQLGPLSEFFEALVAHEGRVLVGCNSWARRFLEQFDEKQLLFSQEDTFPAFDAEALATILERGIGDSATVNSVETGDPIFKRESNGTLDDPFLNDLAEASLGHPWVAIEMFLRGIAEADEKDNETPDSQLWVQLPAACSLPSPANDVHLFALHTLLIHGPRSIEEFDQLLPNPPTPGVWLSLQQNGFVDVENGRVTCTVRNYPDIRSELGAAGFNLDRL